MKYCVGRYAIGPWPLLDISAENFQALKTAKRNIFVLLGIEEKFNMVIDNYLEYERELLDMVLTHLAFHDISWHASHDAISVVNRRLANCLTVSRLYIDQIKHDLSGIYGADAAAVNQVIRAFSVQYDRLLGYRVMEALRNFLQHRSLPVAIISYPAGWEKRNSGQVLHHRIVAKLRIKDLREDKEVKRSVLQEVERISGDTPDVTPLLRQYVEGLSCVHQELQKATGQDIEPWKNAMTGVIQQYSELCNEDVDVVVAYELDDDDTTVEQFEVFRDGIDRLQRFRTRLLPTNVSQWFVSNEAEAD